MFFIAFKILPSLLILLTCQTIFAGTRDNIKKPTPIQCSSAVNVNRQIKQISDIDIRLSEVTEPTVVLGSLIGNKPKRISILDKNSSHFGELAKYNVFFNATMLEILEADFSGQDFNRLAYSQQEQAIEIFIKIVALENSLDTFNRNFFFAYIEKWAYEGLNLNLEAKEKILNFKKSRTDKNKLWINTFGEAFFSLLQIKLKSACSRN